MSILLRTVFESLEQEYVVYCVLRDCDQLSQSTGGKNTGGNFAAGIHEVDLLVHQSQLPPLHRLLEHLGLFRMYTLGHDPHHFYFGYDKDADRWLKFDVVTEIAYGKPIHTLRTQLALNCLSNRQRCGAAFSPSAEDEFVTLLLHCVLDKEDFSASRSRRLVTLCREVTDVKYLSMLLAKYWSPAMSWSQLRSIVETEQWGVLLAERRRVAAYLAGGNRAGILARQIRNRALRKLSRWRNMLQPLSPTVAILAPDGAGKSTLVAAIRRTFYFPVHAVYMGLYQKGKTKAKRVRRLGFGFTQRLFTQWRRYLVARYQQGRGRLVIFDRYTYDSLLPSQYSLTPGKQWRRWLLAHACPAPDMVILLDASGEVLYARKWEHSPTILEQQRQAYLELKPFLPQMVVLDATLDPDRVRREVISLILRAYLTRQPGTKISRRGQAQTEKAEGTFTQLTNSHRDRSLGSFRETTK